MDIPKKLIANLIPLFGVLLFILSVVSTAVGFILFTDPQEFTRSPQMAVIFTVGFLVLIVILISTIQILRHHPNAKRVFTLSAGLGIVLSWFTVIVNVVIYETEDNLGLFLFLTLLFLPLYIQIYLINFQDDVIQWIDNPSTATG